MRGFVIPTRLAFLACLIGLPWLVGACKATTDFGTDCTLVKKNPDGGSIAVAIREGELPDGGKDFISFGAAVCENFVCVRDSAYPKNPNPAAEAMGTAPAHAWPAPPARRPTPRMIGIRPESSPVGRCFSTSRR